MVHLGDRLSPRMRSHAPAVAAMAPSFVRISHPSWQLMMGSTLGWMVTHARRLCTCLLSALDHHGRLLIVWWVLVDGSCWLVGRDAGRRDAGCGRWSWPGRLLCRTGAAAAHGAKATRASCWPVARWRTAERGGCFLPRYLRAICVLSGTMGRYK